MSRIKSLTPEQVALLPLYREKWQRLALRTGAIDPAQATIAIQAAYRAIDQSAPSIHFFEGDLPAFRMFREAMTDRTKLLWRIRLYRWKKWEYRFAIALTSIAIVCSVPAMIWILLKMIGLERIAVPLNEFMLWGLGICFAIAFVFPFLLFFLNSVEFLVGRRVLEQIDHRFRHPLLRVFPGLLLPKVEKQMSRAVSRQIWDASDLGSAVSQMLTWQYINLWHCSQEYWAATAFYRSSFNEFNYQTGCWLDFCISVLGCDHDAREWRVFQALVEHCGWVTPGQAWCLVCDRPMQIRFDDQFQLHAEGEAAIDYASGLKLYAHHGIRLPEQYGRIHPTQWQAEWLLTEQNAELRRVLIRGIGYEKIAQALNAIVLDSWREYTLLRIDAEVDVEPIHLLKMQCPSTASIYVLRVPPTLQTARQAIRWVNWDTDAETFAAQT